MSNENKKKLKSVFTKIGNSEALRSAKSKKTALNILENKFLIPLGFKSPTPKSPFTSIVL